MSFFKVQVWLISKESLSCVLFLTTPQRGSFWQPITGSVESFDLDLKAAAQRELYEESGLSLSVDPIDWSFSFQDRRNRDVTEVGFYAVIPKPCDLVIDPHEHARFEWVSFDLALTRILHETNQQMLEKLIKKIPF
jgi:8-oxo-dGTP pyrophosphatase MutT (NUDIX family)